MLVGPSTLLMTTSTVPSIWRYQLQDENANAYRNKKDQNMPINVVEIHHHGIRIDRDACCGVPRALFKRRTCHRTI